MVGPTVPCWERMCFFPDGCQGKSDERESKLTHVRASHRVAVVGFTAATPKRSNSRVKLLKESNCIPC